MSEFENTWVIIAYLDGLTLQRFVRIVDVLQRDAVELSLVDVRYPVVLPPLRRTDGTFQVVLEADIGESENGQSPRRGRDGRRGKRKARINEKVPSNWP